MHQPHTNINNLKNGNMKEFNAEQAKAISNSLNTDELYGILAEIKTKAEQGETVLYIYKQISKKTVDALKDRGFKVTDQHQVSVMKEELYYSIGWA